MDPLDPADYERIKPPKKGKPYPYKCRYCGAPATWRETFKSRDRRRCRVTWCVCDRCYRDAGGTMHVGQQPRHSAPLAPGHLEP